MYDSDYDSDDDYSGLTLAVPYEQPFLGRLSQSADSSDDDEKYTLDFGELQFPDYFAGPMNRITDAQRTRMNRNLAIARQRRKRASYRRRGKTYISPSQYLRMQRNRDIARLRRWRYLRALERKRKAKRLAFDLSQRLTARRFRKRYFPIPCRIYERMGF